MEIGLYGNTHGQAYRGDTDMFLAHTSIDQMQPVRVAQAAERAGIHSIWYPDHVSMPIDSTSHHTANVSGQRAYQPRHNMLDGAVVMGAVAASTTKLKLAPSCLIAPYRHPLADARQFATLDRLSNGRVMLGVAAGWMDEEFASLGQDYQDRNAQTEECIEIYKRAWSEDSVSFQGRFYQFENLSMDPKPVQKPRPPIVYGANTPAGARRAIRLCDGIYPLFLDTYSDPDRHAGIQDLIRREADKIGRDVGQFLMLCAATARLTDADDADARANPRRTCTGTAEQVIGDLERLAQAGFSLVVCMIDCPSGRLEELEEQIQRFGEEVIPHTKGITPGGEWQPVV